MKYDEFAFFNQQLAAMLRDGIPLEGALKRLCREMRTGRLRTELEALEADLARGTPIADALSVRQLPELYQRMILVGVKSGDLPGALAMLADYYHQQSNLWTRMKGLLVYPLIILLASFLISCLLAYLLHNFIWTSFVSLTGHPVSPAVYMGLWMTPVILGLLTAAIMMGIMVSPARRALRWKLPAFREASLAQIASAIWLMLKNGVPLDDALALAQQLESGSAAGKEISRWRQKLAAGHQTFFDIADSGISSAKSVFPPLFLWTISQAGEDLTAGFQRTAELFRSRAAYRTELLLYSLLPCAVILLASMIISQISPVFHALILFIQQLSGGSD